ncbi:MAG TPA: MarR family transcriptional regulator [Firmicutes bacterium]|nr:MarR family transcriptional regulator [Bacillota bacterium]
MLMQDLVLIAKSAQSFIQAHRAVLGLTGIEQTVCMYIYLHHHTNQERLAKALLMDKGNVAKMMASLENEGFLSREENPDNRRENIVSLTPKGTELIKEMVQLCAGWEEMVLQDVSIQEAEIFRNVCSKISQRAERWKEAGE